MDVKPNNAFRWKIALIAIVILASGILLMKHSDSLRQPWRTLLSLAYGFVLESRTTEAFNALDAPKK
jgi:hypothetical protein